MTVTDEINELATTKAKFKTLLKNVYGDKEKFGTFQNYTNYFTDLINLFKSLFENVDDFIDIILPLFITSIPDRMFQGKTKLTKITGENVTSIGNYVFDGCSALNSCLRKSKLTSIGACALRNTSNFRSGFDFSNIILIGEGAFYNSGISSVTLDNDVTLGDNVFSLCNNLSNFYAPKQTIIPRFTFDRCYNLTNLYIPMATTIYANAFDSVNLNINYSAPEETLYALYLPNATDIRNFAFANATINGDINLQVLEELNDSVFVKTAINGNINLPNIKTINNSAFDNCSIEGTILIGENIETISDTAFNTCEGNFEIHINKPTGSITGAPWGATNAKVVWNSTGA